MNSDTGMAVKIIREGLGFRWILFYPAGIRIDLIQGANPHPEILGCRTELRQFVLAVLNKNNLRELNGSVWEKCPAEDNVDSETREGLIASLGELLNAGVRVRGEGIDEDFRAIAVNE